MLPHADLIFQATVVAHPGHHKSRILQMMVELEGGGHFFVDFPPFGYGPANLSQFATRASNGAGTGGWRRIIISRSSTSTVARFSMSRSAASRGWRGSVGALRVGVRDRWIGWTDAQRLSPDLQNRHGDPALLAKTFVDGARFSGTCDRAANGWCLGSTAGFSRMQGEVSDSPHHDFIDQLKKAIYYIVDPEKSQIQRSRSEYAEIYSLKVWIPMAGYGLMDAPFLAISEDKMRPRPCAGTESHDRFRNRLENRLDRRHARVRLAGILDGSRCDETFGVRYGPDRGSPGQPPRGMVGRESLQPVYPLSDEAVVAGWVENPYGQSCCGEDYCPPHPPIDPSRRTRCRPRIGTAGAEWVLPATIDAGLTSGTGKPRAWRRVTVDTTVPDQAVTFPTNGKRWNRSPNRHHLRCKAASSSGGSCNWVVTSPEPKRPASGAADCGGISVTSAARMVSLALRSLRARSPPFAGDPKRLSAQRRRVFDMGP